jgi:glycosyltransferase involved in cell wall biosynthesis
VTNTTPTPTAGGPKAHGKLPSLTAFFPAHNEEANVVPMAEGLLSVLPQVAERWELVIVDDGSLDRTGALADEFARANPGVRVVHHATNLGYGGAIKSGLAASRLDYIFYTDGDRQFDPAEIERLMVPLDQADVVVGYRANRADNVIRRLNGVAWNTLVRALFGVRVRDVDCAFKLFRATALAGVAPRAEGAMISTELLARIRERGHRIVEVPVSHYPRQHGSPSGANVRVILRAFVELFRLRRQLRAEFAQARAGAAKLSPLDASSRD